jgi:hypothetical protein
VSIVFANIEVCIFILKLAHMPAQGWGVGILWGVNFLDNIEVVIFVLKLAVHIPAQGGVHSILRGVDFFLNLQSTCLHKKCMVYSGVPISFLEPAMHVPAYGVTGHYRTPKGRQLLRARIRTLPDT